MPGSGLVTHTLDVPGARLYYERRGTGSLLLMIGSPMDSTGFAGLASALAGQYTVVTYDPRGIGSSTSSLRGRSRCRTPTSCGRDGAGRAVPVRRAPVARAAWFRFTKMRFAVTLVGHTATNRSRIRQSK